MTAWQLLKRMFSSRNTGVVLALLVFDILVAVIAVASGQQVLVAAPAVVVNAVAIRWLANSR
ncbi:hypothetical protein ABZ901_16590 [Actinacidiphila alni]|uniref:hypothetical protein n=1 Tax=Actinacidiphila alni TaxID=380248 RepID=UPI0033D6D527